MPCAPDSVTGPVYVYGLFSYIFYAVLVALFFYLNATYPTEWSASKGAFSMRASNENYDAPGCATRDRGAEHH
jgi:hypothetical protein